MRLLDKFKKKGFESENVKPENSEEIIVDRFPLLMHRILHVLPVAMC